MAFFTYDPAGTIGTIVFVVLLVQLLFVTTRAFDEQYVSLQQRMRCVNIAIFDTIGMAAIILLGIARRIIWIFF